MKQLTRIVTMLGYPGWGTPRQMLRGGTQTLSLPDKKRFFVVRNVTYDEDMTPLFATPYPYEKRFESLKELYKEKHVSPQLADKPILDLDNSLSIYKHEVWDNEGL